MCFFSQFLPSLPLSPAIILFFLSQYVESHASCPCFCLHSFDLFFCFLPSLLFHMPWLLPWVFKFFVRAPCILPLHPLHALALHSLLHTFLPFHAIIHSFFIYVASFLPCFRSLLSWVLFMSPGLHNYILSLPSMLTFFFLSFFAHPLDPSRCLALKIVLQFSLLPSLFPSSVPSSFSIILNSSFSFFPHTSSLFFLDLCVLGFFSINHLPLFHSSKKYHFLFLIFLLF